MTDPITLAVFTTRFKREIDELVLLLKKDLNYGDLDKDKVKQELSWKFKMVVDKAHVFIKMGVEGAKRLWLRLKWIEFWVMRALKKNQPLVREEEILEKLVERVDKIIEDAIKKYQKTKTLYLSFEHAV